jgi:hypothetical protein
MLALVATYTSFFAEPRYPPAHRAARVPVRRAGAGRDRGAPVAAGVRRSRAGAFHAARALVPALVLVVVWRFAWPP